MRSPSSPQFQRASGGTPHGKPWRFHCVRVSSPGVKDTSTVLGLGKFAFKMEACGRGGTLSTGQSTTECVGSGQCVRAPTPLCSSCEAARTLLSQWWMSFSSRRSPCHAHRCSSSYLRQKLRSYVTNLGGSGSAAPRCVLPIQMGMMKVRSCGPRAIGRLLYCYNCQY